MKKIIISLSIITIMSTILFVVQASAAGKSGLAGKSQTGHLYLNEKNPSDWSILSGGAWGKMTYKIDGYVFNGHKLNPSEKYTLINYARVGTEWPASIKCLETVMSNENGDVHMMGDWNITEFGHDTTPGTENQTGYKFWLVPSSDVNCITGKLPSWNPSEYLFEEVPIYFD